MLMDFCIALKGLLSGHHLRQKNWPEDNYIYFKDDSFHQHIEGHGDRPLTEFAAKDILSKDWELF